VIKPAPSMIIVCMTELVIQTSIARQRTKVKSGGKSWDEEFAIVE